MKMITALCFFILFYFTIQIFAQVPNGGFENWTGTEPDFWITNNSDPYFTVTQSNSSHSGSFALKGECIAFVPPILPVIGPVAYCSGSDDFGFLIEFRFNSLKGFYKLNSQGGDQVYINIIVALDSAAIGGGGIVLNDAASYTEFAAPISYINQAIPNRCIVSVQIYNSGGGMVTLGSEMYLDDLSLSMDVVSVEIEEMNSTTFNLSQNYPNPFNPGTKIDWNSPTSGWQSIKLYNTLGKEVETIVEGFFEAGNHSILYIVNSTLPSGVYFYKLQAGSFTETKKMVLMK